jgi:hypothetical protein
MEPILSEKREIQSEKSEMSCVENFETELQFSRRVMRSVIAPPGTADSKGERLRLAVQKLRWTYSRTRDVWYGDSRVSLKPHELRRIEEVSGVKYGKQEVNEIDQLIARADALLAGSGTDIHRSLRDFLRETLRIVARAGTEGR